MRKIPKWFHAKQKTVTDANQQSKQPPDSEPVSSDDEDNPPAVAAKAKVRFFIANTFSYGSLRVFYFMFVGLVGAVLIFVFEEGTCGFVDCLFMSYSAITNTGLITVNPASWKWQSQVVAMVMILLGGQVLMTTLPVVIRRQYFRQGYYAQRKEHKGHRHEAEYQGLGLVKELALWIFIGIQLLGSLILGLYMAFVPSKKSLCERNDVNPWWFGLFHAISAFNNAGMTLLPDNLMQFKDDHFILLITCSLILLGNTAYPVLLRAVVYMQHKRNPHKIGFHYLLRHPRRCSTHLFPALHTVFIAAFVALFTFVMLITFVALHNEPAFDNDPKHVQALVAFFQAVSTRTAGFNTIDISLLAPAMQVMYCVLMYVSSYPVISAIRSVSAIAELARPRKREVPPEEQLDENHVINEIGSITSRTLAGTITSRAPDPPPVVHKQVELAASHTLLLPPGAGAARLAIPNSKIKHPTADTNTPANPASSSASATTTTTKQASSRPQSTASTAPNTSRSASNLVTTSDSLAPSPKPKPPIVPFPDLPHSNGTLSSAPTPQTQQNENYSNETPNVTSVAMHNGTWVSDDLRSTLSQIKASILADSWLLIAALFVICVAEDRIIRKYEPLSVFDVLFEITSGFGTVGLSVGFPGTSASLSGVFSDFSKFVMMIVMLAGRQRGLPRSIDSSVHLPALFNVVESPKVISTTIATYLRHARNASFRRADTEPLRATRQSTGDSLPTTTKRMTRYMSENDAPRVKRVQSFARLRRPRFQAPPAMARQWSWGKNTHQSMPTVDEADVLKRHSLQHKTERESSISHGRQARSCDDSQVDYSYPQILIELPDFRP